MTVWADSCVRLDKMEADILNSKLLDQIYSSSTVKTVVDSCIHGRHLPTAFNITDVLNFEYLESQIYSQLTIDLSSSFDIAELNDFESFLAGFDKKSYQMTVDLMMTVFNVDYPQSVPLTRPWLDDQTSTGFDRSKLGVAANLTLAEIQKYHTKEVNNAALFDNKINAFQTDANQMVAALTDLKDFSMNHLQANLTAIKCNLSPVFEEMRSLVQNNDTAWCNEVGVIYGKLKAKGCDDLFTNYEYTNRSLLVIAIFSLFIGFLSVGMARRIDRELNIHDKKQHDFGVEMGAHK